MKLVVTFSPPTTMFCSWACASKTTPNQYYTCCSQATTGNYLSLFAKLVEEQRRYSDRPNNIDSFIQQRLHGDNFPTLANVLLISAPATGHSITTSFVLNLLVHQIIYICDLLQKTDYARSVEVVEVFADYCIG